MVKLMQFIINKKILGLGLLLIILASTAVAKNIDLSTLPARNKVQLTIYNSENLTLVRETRQVSIKKGRNQLQFSWANTQIDPTSVQIEFISHPMDIHLVNTRFAHDKPQMLYWHINSEINQLSTVEISYFTTGISWKADYSAILSADGKNMSWDSFVTVSNYSGEDYDNAQVRLVLGKINLVEQVGDIVSQAKAKKNRVRSLQRELRKKTKVMPMVAYADAVEFEEPLIEGKSIEKKSLSEYTIFTIEGTENIANLSAKKLRSNTTKQVNIDMVYRYRVKEYGSNLSRILLFKNDKKSSLGESALPEGRVQIYQENTDKKKDGQTHNRQDGLTYISAVTLNYTAINEKIELNTGVNPEVSFELIPLKDWHDQIWMYYNKANVYRRLDDGHIKVDHNSRVVGWNEHQILKQKINNSSDSPIKIEIRRTISGDVLFKSALDVKKHDYKTIDIVTQLRSGERQELLYETVLKKGRNKKQNQVILSAKTIKSPY